MDGKSKDAILGDSGPARPGEESHGVLLRMNSQPPANMFLGTSLRKPTRQEANSSPLGKAKPVAEMLVVNE